MERRRENTANRLLDGHRNNNSASRENLLRNLFQRQAVLNQPSTGTQNRLLLRQYDISNLDNGSDDEEDGPPEDFTLLNVYPTVQDLYDREPFVRPAKITEPYKSLMQYLDVQFRLLREDFFGPLRTGLYTYIHRRNEKVHNTDLRIYKKVKLVLPEIRKDNVGIRLHFGKMKFVNWQHSKRLIYGSLIMLSHNNFKNILFMTVADRNIRDLEQGFILVQPCFNEKIPATMYDLEYVMLESKIYFEPYMAVLTALKNKVDQVFPMKDYIVFAKSEIRPPEYLKHQTLEYENMVLSIDPNALWPLPEELGLDESQHAAFKHALTSEFALIQGPPGTGKTFIALEIVQTLLKNKSFWRYRGPIVIVCYTNHALDSFLEGISKYTRSIVRVGNRSKSEKLKKFALCEKRKHFRSQDVGRSKYEMFEVKQELEQVMGYMAETRLIVQLLTTEYCIVPLECLTWFCKDDSLQNKFKTTSNLVSWLVDSNILDFKNNICKEPTININADKIDEREEEHQYDDNKYRDDRIYLKYTVNIPPGFQPIFPLNEMDSMIEFINKEILQITNSQNKPDPKHKSVYKLRDEVKSLIISRNLLKDELSMNPIIYQSKVQIANEKWRKYWTWVKRSYEKAVQNLMNLENKYRMLHAKMDKLKEEVDLAIMKKHDIIGLTTTCAAKSHVTLQNLSAPIVLVEEAAEILESHVVCSISKGCQHVILIGDHKQLKPKLSVYDLGNKYNLNVSLFERIIRIRGNCNQLVYQHRMRPTIAKLVTPIYDKYCNHESVLDYPNVMGLRKNLFFINHNYKEIPFKNDESWVNQFEAEFLVAFARHLLKQGYKPSEITILCTYTGQLFELKDKLKTEMKSFDLLRDVQITTVDNFQGEENRIILLSLVRNNGEGNVGFLREENRVCVALSRAREGLYIMGNMDDLVAKSGIWHKVRDTLKEENCIDETLGIFCQIHSDETIRVKKAKDFIENCPEGGCSKKCERDLLCGHVCPKFCHVIDREHKEFKCRKACNRLCANDHLCPLECGQVCQPCKIKVERTLKCGHHAEMLCSTDPDKHFCKVQVSVVMPGCQHNIFIYCSSNIQVFKCTHDCENRLPCGHKCQLKCHFNDDPDHVMYKCNRDCPKNYNACENNHLCKKRCYEDCGPCPIIVSKTRSCSHHYKAIACSIKIEEIFCEKNCPRKIPECGHKCRLRCSDKCGNCQERVLKKSTCGHSIKIKCCEEATPALCNKKCTKTLVCGHPCVERCKDICTKNCKILVPLNEESLCGHKISVPCYLKYTDPRSSILLQYCTKRCNAILKCEHKCNGTCSSCYQGRIHSICSEPCSNIFICGHKCSTPCREQCQPCNRPCANVCKHSKCSLNCGKPCITCKEKCNYGCEHQKCSKYCGEICDIEPCDVPCEKLLKCGHPCVGYCGETCPPLCRICNHDELTSIFFGNEDSSDAKFVYLEDCRHVIESTGLERWMKPSEETGNQSLQLKTCPKCTTPIKKCLRVMNQIKLYLRAKQRGLVISLKNLKARSIIKGFPEINKLLLDMLNRGENFKKNKRRQDLNFMELDCFDVQLNLLQEMIKMVDEGKAYTSEIVKKQVSLLVKSIPNTWIITNQREVDFGLELRRLHYMVKACEFIDEEQSNYLKSLLLSIGKLDTKLQHEIEEEMQKLKQLVTKYERQMIHKAMGMGQGHWFKCPKGHIYAIGNCGGANQRSKCPECGSDIGGMNYILAAGNSLANDMDGASRPAWEGMV